MGFSLYYSTGVCMRVRPEFGVLVPVVCSERKEPGAMRRRVLRKVDNELAKGNTKTALSLVKQLQGKPGGLRGFGGAKQVPLRRYSLDELNLSETEISTLQPVMKSILKSIDISLRLAALPSESLERLEEEGMKLDTVDDVPCEDYYRMCTQHEAGHFLTAYLLGVLPKRYTIPSLEAMRNNELVGGRVDFIGFEFLSSVRRITSLKDKRDAGKVSPMENRVQVSSRVSDMPLLSFNTSAYECCLSTPSKDNNLQIQLQITCKAFSLATYFSLQNYNRLSCVALGGLTAECLSFGYSEGSFNDVEQIETLFQSLGFTRAETDAQIKWSVLNTLSMLSRHYSAILKLAAAMSSGKSIGFCIDTIESSLVGSEI
ncbi:uncharacterized protein LOC113336706 isoform X1 [Papaver somniferum]|uniref:uncharacterized protein LOC113336706 isoform X1 n=1 Tax=Papaver somniferum TaxID=3469 RepID=UPI000E70498D|nr:uncharacterized protein LOC113336706 isoform X1 [Papaver somniferum]